MRKAKPKKRLILPDPVFNDQKVSKFVNHLMYDGKKNTSYEIFYAALETVKAKLPNEEKSALEIWKKALDNVTPQVEVKSRRVGGATFQVPTEIRPDRKESISMKNLILFARKRGGKSMADKLAAEILNPEQAQYYFLSGFTAKLAGTERGITEPTPTFSACFGAAFLSLHPTKYAEELVKKMEMTGAKAYLVNTGWNGTGKRISIKDTRGIIDAILDGSIDKAPTKVIPYFDFVVPTELPGVDPNILDPRDTYADAAQWDEKAKDLAGRFIKNFAKFTGNEAGKKLVAAGPKL